VVGVVEAGQTVGNDLRCGLGGGIGGGLLIGGLFGSGQIMLGRRRQSRLGARNDENLFELVEIGSGPDLDEGVGLVIRVGLDGFDGPDGKPARVDLVATRAKHLLTYLDPRVGSEIADNDLACGAAAKNSAQPSACQQDASP
jgi:hypothetical protein